MGPPAHGSTVFHRTIQQLLKATDTQILDMLMKDKFLPNWEGCGCPFCNKGILGPLPTRSQRETKAYRCNQKNCHKFVYPPHLHPIFALVPGPKGHSVQVQAAAHLLRLAGVSPSAIHLLANINDKAVERNHSLNLVCSGHITKVEKNIKFGGAPKHGKTLRWTRPASTDLCPIRVLAPQRGPVGMCRPAFGGVHAQHRYQARVLTGRHQCCLLGPVILS